MIAMNTWAARQADTRAIVKQAGAAIPAIPGMPGTASASIVTEPLAD